MKYKTISVRHFFPAKGAIYYIAIATVIFSHEKINYATPKVTKYQRCNFIVQIHKFTFKIDTISINVLFECVKIVEFNFNSYVFLVMYQEIRLLKQDSCFFRSRRETTIQFLISSVSERDWKRAHGLEFKMVSNRFYIPNANVCSPFCSSAGTVWTKIPMGARKISCKTSRGISTHFADDVWSSCVVGQQHNFSSIRDAFFQLPHSEFCVVLDSSVLPW